MSSASLRAGLGQGSQALSNGIAVVERGLVMVFVAAILVLILVNIATRAIGRPIVWIDELSVYLMVMTCFVGTSLTVRQRLDFAMTLVVDHLKPGQLAVYRGFLSLVGVAYAGFIVWCCWRMFDPVGLWQSNFNIDAFTTKTMNFLYAEPTQTLGIPKWIIYLVMPLYALGLTVHALANLAQDLGWAGVVGSAGGDAVTLEAG